MTQHGSPAPTGAPDRRLADRFAVVVTIASGAFGVAAVVGLNLLPASTRAQQALIILAGVALGVATYAGVGAWYSAGRFTVTALSTAAVLVCLASLAIVTESSVRADLANGTGRGSAPAAGSATGGERTTPEVTGDDAYTPEPTGAGVYLSGQLYLNPFPFSERFLDLDSATTASDQASLDGDREVDLALHGLGMDTFHGSQVAVLAAPEPSAAECAASGWEATAHVSNLADDRSLCVLTSEGRIGAITVIEQTKDDDGTMEGLRFEYVVWKKRDDA